MQNKGTIGGILSIISGVFGILGMALGLLSAFFFNALIPADIFYSGGEVPFGDISTFLWVVYGGWGVVSGILGILGIVGGIFALKRKHWGLALAGSIAGIITFFLTGIPAVIFTAMAHPEFKAPVDAAPVTAPSTAS